MKKIKLQLQDINGEVHAESEVTVGDKDTLVVQFPDDMPLDMASNLFDMVQSALSRDKGIIGVPNSVSFLVIKKV
jgi:hypothetical protein